MKRVQLFSDEVLWKCEYCSLTNPNSNVIIEHELYCAQNPINRNCPTCKVYGTWMVCNFAGSVGAMGCNRWKNLPYERINKLTLLKNKIKDKTI